MAVSDPDRFPTEQDKNIDEVTGNADYPAGYALSLLEMLRVDFELKGPISADPLKIARRVGHFARIQLFTEDMEQGV